MQKNNINKLVEFIALKEHKNKNDKFLNSLSEFLSKLLDIDYILISNFDVDNPTVATIEVLQTKTGPLKNKSYNLKGTPCQNVINKELCSYSSNLQGLFPEDKMLIKMQAESYIGIPLFSVNEQPIGIISFLNCTPLENIKELELVLQIVSIKVSQVLEKQLQDVTLESQLKTLQLAQNKALESELKFKIITNNSADGIAVTALDGSYLYVNPSFCNMVGYSEKELLKLRIQDLFPKSDPTINSINCTNTPDNKPIKVIFETKKGKLITTEIVRTKTILNGENVNLCSIRNITERLLLDANIKIEKENYLQLFEENPVALLENNFTATYNLFSSLKRKGVKNIENYFSKNPEILHNCFSNLKIIDVNNAAVKLFNATSKKHLLINIDKILSNYTLLNYKKILIDLYQDKNEIINQITFKNLQKKEIIGTVKINIFKNKLNKEIKTIISIIDITEKINIETELISSEEKYRSIIENTSEWIWETDNKGIFKYSNGVVEKITGFKPNELIGKSIYHFLSNAIKPFAKKMFNNQVFAEVGWKNLIVKIRGKSGKKLILESFANPIVSKNGSFIGFQGVNRDITFRENAIAEMKKLSTAVEQSSNSILITDLEGKIEYVNSKFSEISGYSFEEVKGKSPKMLNSGTHPESYYKNLWSTINSGKTWSGHFLNKHKDGSLFWEDSTITPITNEKGQIVNFLGIKQDISVIKKTEQLLKKQNEELLNLSQQLTDSNKSILETKNRFVALFDKSPVALWEEDFSRLKVLLNNVKKEVTNLKEYLENNPDFLLDCINSIKVLNVNETALSLFGIINESDKQYNIVKHFTPKSYSTFFDQLCAIANGEKTFNQETDFKSYNGKLITVMLKMVIIDDNYKAIVSMTNITAIKKAKTHLLNQNKKLELAKKQAEESDKLKTEFLNNMSHEIRTPMNGILGFTELLSDSNLSSDRRSQYTRIIQNSGNQLLQVIDDILEISRLETKQVSTQQNTICLNSLLLELFSIFNLKAKENKIPLYFYKGLNDSQSTIITDENKLLKILNNLLENAFKFTNVGHVSMGYELKNEQIEIYVSDTGIGIAKEKQSTIFERFAQEEKELSQKFGGLGLGLSIAKENSELLGGTIKLESEKGKGSKFTVSIPYNPVNTIKEISTLENKTSQTMKSILIAEDEEVNYLFLEMLLVDSFNLNYKILHAKNGLEAVDICKNNSDIGLVLMDIKMPKMNGYEATALIKEFNSEIPIVAQTAYSTPEDKEKAYLAGCWDFLPKPITRKSLEPIISKYLKI